MKYMLIMRATDETFAASQDVDFTEIMEAMGKFNDEMIRAGVLLAAEGLDPDPESGVVVDYSSETPVVTDGPYGETKELFGGFWMLNVASKEELSSGPSVPRWLVPVPKQRSAGSRRSTSSRRTTCGSRRSGRGAKRPVSSERIDG